MSENDFELTPEQQQAFHEAFQKAVEAARAICDAFAEIYQSVLERIREIALGLARFFLKLQLLEWKLPYSIADFISKNAPEYWAMRLGFNWLERKYALKE